MSRGLLPCFSDRKSAGEKFFGKKKHPILHKNLVVGVANFNISLIMESWSLALLFFNCFIALEIFSALSGESNTELTRLIMCLVEELLSWVFSEWKSLEKCSTQLFGEITLRVPELTLPLVIFVVTRSVLDCLLMIPIS